VLPVASKSGVALRFPPQSKICGCGVSRAGLIRVKKHGNPRQPRFKQKRAGNSQAGLRF